MENPEKIEIAGLKTIHKLCNFGADHNMEGCTFTEIVERMFSKIEQMKTQVNTLDEMLLNQGEALAQAKTQAVPEKTVKLHLVWNENKDECVGFLDSKDARYTATGDDRGMFGVTALGDYFRDLNDERDEFETQIVMIEAQEPSQ